MSRYLLGQPVRVDWTVTDVDGTTPVAPSTQTLTLQRPDLTLGTPYTSPSTTGVGSYYQVIPAADLTQLGPYQWKVTTTGDGAGTVTGSFSVVDPFETELLSLDDAKQHLNIPAATTTYDAELEVYVAAVTGAVEGIIGPVGRRTVTEVITPSSGVLVLGQSPVLSITSITPYAGVALDPATYTLRNGVVYPAMYSSGFWVAINYSVVEVVGRASVPAEVNLAARIILAHLWETQRGVSDSAFAETAEGLSPGFGFAIPNRAKELLARYRLAPAVA